MRKSLLLLLVILLLIPQTYAAEEGATLRFGSDEAVYSIYASYEVAEDVTDVTVTFADCVKSYAYANFVNGKLWVSIASMNAIDLNKPMAWVTAKHAGGQEIVPALKLASLKFNGKAAKCNLFMESIQASLKQETLNVTIRANDSFLGNYTLVTASYDVHGKLLTNDVRNVDFGEAQETFVVNLADCSEAACVKAFFLSSEWGPIAVAEDREIS